MKKSYSKLVRITLLIFLVSACQEEITPIIKSVEPSTTVPIENPDRIQRAYLEDFEGASKDFFSQGSVAFASGAWLLTDAVVGYSNSDRKYNFSSVRLVNAGKLSMQYNITQGFWIVTIAHATYGSDASSNWELWFSADSGITYHQAGETLSTTLALTTATFTLNTPGNIRLEIRKVSGGASRINIDDIQVTPYTTTRPEEPAQPDDGHMLLGNPSLATTDISNENNYLMDKTQYVLSYNRSTATPNWVSWHIDATSFGSGQRQDNFRPDTALPASWYRVSSSSYKSTGFDRGHNCPSGDRTASNEINSTTFLMTNMIPQAPNNNQRTWVNLEEYTRKLVKEGNEAFVIMGVYGVGGTGANGYAEKINSNNITVPSRIWKVVLIIPQGNNDLIRITPTTRVIAIDTPNDNSINSSWENYRVSIDAIEAATGYDLLSTLPNTIEMALESVVDTGSVN